MERLSYKRLAEIGYTGYLLENAPERVLQFGGGVFMRAFVDYFFDIANERAGFNGKIVICNPTAKGTGEVINEQEGLYTLYLRGTQGGEKVVEKRIISSVSRCINPYTDFESLLDCASNEDLRYITSNTTEAGIAYDPDCSYNDTPPKSFPAKLARFMHERFKIMGNIKGKGFVILSCELIDDNGKKLREYVIKYANQWGLEQEFINWLEQENLFCSTLVDRIATGYPSGEADVLNSENGYIDKAIDTAEIFALWVIEGPKWLAEELAINKAELPIKVTENHTPYKKQKVRILNGAHTSMVLAAHLCGFKIVRECMQDEVVNRFLTKAMQEEIIPTLTLPKQQLTDFANSVVDRFNNPYIDHELLSITLNSTDKWKVRVMPSLTGYQNKFNQLPPCLTFSLAAYIEFYRRELDINTKDNEEVLQKFRSISGCNNAEVAKKILGASELWGCDLTQIPNLQNSVTTLLNRFDEMGVYAVMREVILCDEQ